MVLPTRTLALLGAGLVAGTLGTAGLAKGSYDLNRARSSVKNAAGRYEIHWSELEANEVATNDRLGVLRSRQAQAIDSVVERMADFLRRHQKMVAESEKLLVDGIEPAAGLVIADGGLGQDAASWIRGATGTLVAGVGVARGLPSLARQFAAASTGTELSALNGAALTNATHAFFGGGSKASGGAGMKTGRNVLTVTTIGSATFVAGVATARQGEKAKTQATEHQSRIDIEIERMALVRTVFDAVMTQVDERLVLLDGLVARASTALDLLESEPFDPESHAIRFQHALTLTIAVRDVAITPVVDAFGEMDHDGLSLKIKYRALVKEATDV